MVAGVEARIEFTVRASQVGATNDLGTPRAPASVEFLKQFLAGTANDNQLNLLYSGDVTLASGASGNLDLAGVLATGLGATVTMAEVAVIALIADADNTTNLTFFGAASNAFNGPLGGTTPTLTLKPGAAALLTDPDGWAVTAGTGDIMAVTNGSGASASYQVILIGRTAAS